jgi:DNA-binding transcriptional LysR family regulator
MQLQQVRYFLAILQERSFTRAARRCGVSQPSLTNAIRRLEQDLGGALFKRKPEVALTVLGHAVHPYLQRIVENADFARDTGAGSGDIGRSQGSIGRASRNVGVRERLIHRSGALKKDG